MKRWIILFFIFLCLLIFKGTGHTLCVNVPEANLRNGPGTTYGQTWKVYRHMPFLKKGKKGDWYKVKDIDGDQHWIYAKLVTNQYRCAAVQVEKAKVRSGPGTSYKETPLSPVIKYYSFRVIDTKGKWVKVSDEFNNRGWVFKSLLWIQ